MSLTKNTGKKPAANPKRKPPEVAQAVAIAYSVEREARRKPKAPKRR